MESKIIMNGLIEVCSDGTIYQFKNGVKEKANITKLSKNYDYRSISLSINKKQKQFYVHRLVAETFVQKADENKKLVTHKDGNRGNNCASNLEWKCYNEVKKKKKNYYTCKICGSDTMNNLCLCAKCRKEIEKEPKKEENRRLKKSKLVEKLGKLNLESLDSREIEIINLRMQNLTIIEIAGIMGCSKGRVQQIVKKAIDKDAGKMNKGYNYLNTLERYIYEKNLQIDKIKYKIEKNSNELFSIKQALSERKKGIPEEIKIIQNKEKLEIRQKNLIEKLKLKKIEKEKLEEKSKLIKMELQATQS